MKRSHTKEKYTLSFFSKVRKSLYEEGHFFLFLKKYGHLRNTGLDNEKETQHVAFFIKIQIPSFSLRKFPELKFVAKNTLVNEIQIQINYVL